MPGGQEDKIKKGGHVLQMPDVWSPRFGSEQNAETPGEK